MTREIPLSRGLVALVDDQDFDLVMSAGKWYADADARTFYGRRNYWIRDSNGRKHCKSLKMHSFLTGWSLVDHVNGDGLDNRRANLRPATSAQNSYNRGLRSDNTSGFKGVQWHKQTRAWRAVIQADGRSQHLGQYSTPEAAAQAYDAAAALLFGEYARLNFPKELVA